MSRDFFGGFASLGGKAFYLLGYDGETAASLPCASGFDRRIKCEQICLCGNAANEIADLADFVDRCRKTRDCLGDCLGLAARLTCYRC